jgi:hypothetical protein
MDLDVERSVLIFDSQRLDSVHLKDVKWLLLQAIRPC